MTWDAIVIGGGSAGLAAGLTLARAVRRTLVIDAGSPRNGRAPHSHGVIGFDGAAPSRMLEIAAEDVRRFNREIRRDDVLSAGRAGDEFLLETARGDSLLTRQLIVATGVRDHLPDVPGVAELWGTHVVICPYCDGWEWRGSRIGILGTGAKSLFQTHLLRQWSDRVTLFSNSGLVPTETDLEELDARGIELVDAPVTGLALTDDGAVRVSTAEESHDVDVVFTAPRAVPNDGVLRALGAECSDTPGGSFVVVDARGATSVDGLWATGNVVDPSLKVQTASGHGMATATHVNERLVRLDVEVALEALRRR